MGNPETQPDKPHPEDENMGATPEEGKAPEAKERIQYELSPTEVRELLMALGSAGDHLADEKRQILGGLKEAMDIYYSKYGFWEKQSNEGRESQAKMRSERQKRIRSVAEKLESLLPEDER